MQVYDFMVSGVKLTGRHDTPPCYPEKIRPATLTQSDLETSSVWRRKAILGKQHIHRDLQHVQHLEETAAEEVQMGFIEGPFSSESEVSEYFGHSHWMVIRRFVLVQGAEMKLRPIDDCLEAQLNQAFTSTSHLKLQDVDYVTGLALKIAEAVAEGRQAHGSGRWLGKCLDLSKAYKQVGIHPSHRHLSVIFFSKADGAPAFYIANSLMFGATAAVYSFNRISRSLWFLLNRMLVIPCGVFYDDFPLFLPAEAASNADESASELHARTGPKGKPFEEKLQVLGCSLDLSAVADGQVTTENRPGVIDRVLDQVEKIKAANAISLHEAQVLHGLLRYACGFFAGRHLHQVCAEVLTFGMAKTPYNRRSLGDFVIMQLQCERRVWAGEVRQCLLDRWAHLVGDQLICQIELFAMVALRWILVEQLRDRRTIWWVDNDAARFSAIKGNSPSLVMKFLVRTFYHFEAEAPTYSWIERIPSASNPSDGPSRGKPEEVMQLLRVQKCKAFTCPPKLVAELMAL
eukprot:s804_g2.t1